MYFLLSILALKVPTLGIGVTLTRLKEKSHTPNMKLLIP